MPSSSEENSQANQRSSREDSRSSGSSQDRPTRKVIGAIVCVGLVVSYSILGTELIGDSIYKYDRFGRAMLDGVFVNSSTTLNEVTSVENFWEYINGTLFTSLFAYQLMPATMVDSWTYPPVDSLRSNYLVGDILMFNWRSSQDENCEVKQPFAEYVNKCFPPSEALNSSSYGSPVSEFHSTPPESIPVTFPPFPGVNMNEGGFFQAISSNATEAFKGIDSLISNTFIDPTSTRFVGLFFTLYNANFQLFQSFRIFFEITPTQLWKPGKVVLGAFPYWLTPTMFGENLNSSVLALYVVSCFFTVAALVYWTMSLVGSRDKWQFFLTNLAIPAVLLLSVLSLVLLPALLSLPLGRVSESFNATASERESSPFTFFLNSANFSNNFDIVQTVFAINLMLMYVQIILHVGNLLFLPSLRVLGVTGVLIITFGFANYIVQSSSGVGLLWLGDWSDLASSPVGRLLLTAFFLFLIFGCFVYLWAGLGHKMLHHRESSDTSIDKQVEKFLTSFRNACKYYYEYLVFERFNLDSAFKKYLPGFYYRVIVEERLFQQKVEAAITQKSLNRNRRAGFIASEKKKLKSGTVDLDSAAAQMQIHDQFKVNLETLDDAAATVHGRMVEVDEQLSAELVNISKQVAEIEKYITILDRKVNL